jgi:hypothetical protein
MSQQMSRRSALKIASGASFVAAWFVAGCSQEAATDPNIKTGEPKSAEDSISGNARKNGPTAAPAPTQRTKGGGPG